jgi:hypothetical protein
MNVLSQRRRKQTARCWIEGGLHALTQDQPTVKAYCEVNTWFGGHPGARRNGNELANLLRDIQVADQSLQSPFDNEERTRLSTSVHHAGLGLTTSGHEAEGQITTASSPVMMSLAVKRRLYTFQLKRLQLRYGAAYHQMSQFCAL